MSAARRPRCAFVRLPREKVGHAALVVASGIGVLYAATACVLTASAVTVARGLRLHSFKFAGTTHVTE